MYLRRLADRYALQSAPDTHTYIRYTYIHEIRIHTSHTHTYITYTYIHHIHIHTSDTDRCALQSAPDVCMCVCTNICMCMCVNGYIYICIHMHVYVCQRIRYIYTDIHGRVRCVSHRSVHTYVHVCACMRMHVHALRNH